MRINLHPALALTWPLWATAAVVALGSCVNDPVADTRLTALGDDFPAGLEETQYHRPGQPCVTCHGKRGSASPKFSVAGTVFWGSCNISKTDFADEKIRAEKCDLTPVKNAEVRFVDYLGTPVCAVTNCWGNFTVPDGQIGFPFLVSVSKRLDNGDLLVERQMQGHVAREGSCAGCHDNPRRADSPGQIYLFPDDERTGKVTIPEAARTVLTKERGEACPEPPRAECLPK